jgi:hypothetical protein
MPWPQTEFDWLVCAAEHIVRPQQVKTRISERKKPTRMGWAFDFGAASLRLVECGGIKLVAALRA